MLEALAQTPISLAALNSVRTTKFHRENLQPHAVSFSPSEEKGTRPIFCWVAFCYVSERATKSLGLGITIQEDISNAGKVTKRNEGIGNLWGMKKWVRQAPGFPTAWQSVSRLFG